MSLRTSSGEDFDCIQSQLGGHRPIPFAAMGAIDHASFIALHQALLHILWNPLSFHWAVLSDARLLALALFLFPEEKRGDVAALATKVR